MAKKCDKCLRGAMVRTTGVNPRNRTLELDIGGAVLYVEPKGEIVEVTLNTRSLLDGDYIFCIWNGDKWVY